MSFQFQQPAKDNQPKASIFDMPAVKIATNVALFAVGVVFIQSPWMEMIFTAIFPIVLIALVPLRSLFDWILPNFNPQLWPVINSNSFINTYFAGHSFEIYLCLYLSLYAFSIYQFRKNNFILPRNESDVTFQHAVEELNVELKDTKRLIISQTLKLSILYGLLYLLVIKVPFFSASLFEYIQKFTGGSCTQSNGNGHDIDGFYRQCLISGGKYKGGFKTSGHCFITSLFTLCLIREWSLNLKRIILSVACIGVCSIWLLLFIITNLFYHTFLERLFGTLISYGIYLLIYKSI
ncbi:hypothetical protein DAMA08_000170 [Martiniozyma asiatica (nom. inval.)]|nr:hypothetical protein DAMA08_000170 [Martiniozyma asiatica]